MSKLLNSMIRRAGIPVTVAYGVLDETADGMVRQFVHDGTSESVSDAWKSAKSAFKHAPVATSCNRVLFSQDQFGNRTLIETEYVLSFEDDPACQEQEEVEPA